MVGDCDRARSPEAPKRILLTAPDGDAVSYAVITSRGILSGDIARISAELSESDRGGSYARTTCPIRSAANSTNMASPMPMPPAI